MIATNRDLRQRAFGENYTPTVIDRLGIWLSARRVRKCVSSFDGKRVADIGCGYHAVFARTLLDQVGSMLLVDVSLEARLRDHHKVTGLEGHLPDTLERVPSESIDVLVCNSVVEHLWEPLVTLRHFWRITAQGGVCLINVPSWLGKRALEFSAFRLGASPPEEMDDHKAYYDPRDLWPMLVRAGFLPHDIRCFRHKLGLNTFAICRKQQVRAEVRTHE